MQLMGVEREWKERVGALASAWKAAYQGRAGILRCNCCEPLGLIWPRENDSPCLAVGSLLTENPLLRLDIVGLVMPVHLREKYYLIQSVPLSVTALA